jgi:hypothetical protein
VTFAEVGPAGGRGPAVRRHPVGRLARASTGRRIRGQGQHCPQGARQGRGGGDSGRPGRPPRRRRPSAARTSRFHRRARDHPPPSARRQRRGDAGGPRALRRRRIQRQRRPRRRGPTARSFSTPDRASPSWTLRRRCRRSPRD